MAFVTQCDARLAAHCYTHGCALLAVCVRSVPEDILLQHEVVGNTADGIWSFSNDLNPR